MLFVVSLLFEAWLIVLGFGCTLGSTVSISFVVDSYRADAGSSLTSLNFSKNLIGTTFLPASSSSFLPPPAEAYRKVSFSRW